MTHLTISLIMKYLMLKYDAITEASGVIRANTKSTQNAFVLPLPAITKDVSNMASGSLWAATARYKDDSVASIR